jgi:two-component system NtrC family response regulator
MSEGARKARILIVDDEASARHALSEILTDEGYQVKMAADGFRAIAAAQEFLPDLVLTDLKMPGMDGMALLGRLQEVHPEAAVVLMTAFGAVESAVQAMRQGAANYLTKPLNIGELLLVVERALDGASLRRETKDLREKLTERYDFSNIVGQSAEMRAVFKSVEQVAKSRATVLVSGESGTGKELIASALHHNSGRRDRPFVKLHCAALAESLLESELFGHERGSFTGADRRRIGRFESADGGTLFLDEIGEISPAVQVKLLRVLQEHEFERVGGNQTLNVDVRLVVATNRDLKKLVEQGKFREDLYYRLNVISVTLPPLRERKDDIPALAMHFLRRFALENGKPVERIDPDAMRVLRAHQWPGNVRELENVLERAVVLVEGTVVTTRHLPSEFEDPKRDDGGIPRIPGASLADLERYAILHTLEAVGGSTTQAAQILGISVRKVQYRLREYAEAPKSTAPVLQHEIGVSLGT